MRSLSGKLRNILISGTLAIGLNGCFVLEDLVIEPLSMSPAYEKAAKALGLPKPENKSYQTCVDYAFKYTNATGRDRIVAGYGNMSDCRSAKSRMETGGRVIPDCYCNKMGSPNISIYDGGYCKWVFDYYKGDQSFTSSRFPTREHCINARANYLMYDSRPHSDCYCR